jgi:cytochrome c-type biogenesis protein
MDELNLIVAFTSGVVSFFAPCVVPLLPAYISYISGVSLTEVNKEDGLGVYRRKVMISSLFYVLGFSLIFVMLGTTAASFGSILRGYDTLIQRLGGILIMFFALNFMGVLKIPILATGSQIKLPAWADHLGYGKSFLIGVVFATAWTPCVGAVLGAILTLAAVTQTALSGALMLFVYSLGISIPFLIISLVILQAPQVLKIFTKYTGKISLLAGLLLFIIGFLVFNNTVGLISDKLTYNQLNSLLFEVAFSLGYEIR